MGDKRQRHEMIHKKDILYENGSLVRISAARW